MEIAADVLENELQSKVSSLADKVSALENEKQLIRDEFNIQRAKMKDLYLQKEDEVRKVSAEKAEMALEIQRLSSELDEARSQIVVTEFKMDLERQHSIAQQQIATLQQLVHETVEESSSSRTLFDGEIARLKTVVQKLQSENLNLKTSQPPDSSSSLAPSVVLSAVTKSLVRKLGADPGTDNMDDAMRKAQEDAEVLRSLVIPLEEEIKALKDKLRSTDEQLQEYQLAESQGPNRQGNSQESQKTDSAKQEAVCDMCANYEAQLVRAQQSISSVEIKLAASEEKVQRANEEILREVQLRTDMQTKWEQQKDHHKAQVSSLTSRTEATEQELADLRTTFTQTCSHVMEQLASLTQQREQVDLHLQKLQKDNNNLVGKHSAHSQQLQSEMINLPDGVEELQELLLRSHEELIAAKVCAEFSAEQEQTIKCEVLLLRDQMAMEQQQRETMEVNLVQEIDTLKKQIHQYEKERRVLLSTRDKLSHLENTLSQRTEQHNTQTEEITRQKALVNDLKQRVASLQQELDNSEAVQKDFVRLSQSLQVELEKIRGADTQVRWQHDEDVEECPSCRHGFSVTRRKQHCRHCGVIFCTPCLTHVVASGPCSRPSRVCDVCHTLLVQDTAPYFSTEPPHSPD